MGMLSNWSWMESPSLGRLRDGNKRIETSTIVTYSGLQTGQAFGADDLNRAYQNILASGLFESVEVVPTGARLLIQVSEFPTVNKIASIVAYIDAYAIVTFCVIIVDVEQSPLSAMLLSCSFLVQNLSWGLENG